jgi:SMI1 / KNR4 family (SUKH-1)
MSDLQKALEQFDYWLWDYYPDIFESLLPGLTAEQIEEEVESLPFDLSEEVREFYQWKNGCSNLFYSDYIGRITLLPLDESIKLTHELTGGGIFDDLLEQKQIHNAFFMFRSRERWLHFVECRDEETSPILLLSDDLYLRLAFTSLTSMILTAIECYEKEIFGFTEFGDININDQEAYLSIFTKNNSEEEFIRHKYGVDDIPQYYK